MNDHRRADRASDDKLDAQRDIIRQSLDAIVNDIGMAMRDVGLTFPLYITVRNSGDALVTIATSARPIGCRLAAGIEDRLSNYRREGRLRSVARTRTRLRYCERWRYKCRRPSGVVKACGIHLEGRNINRRMHHTAACTHMACSGLIHAIAMRATRYARRSGVWRAARAGGRQRRAWTRGAGIGIRCVSPP